ncbi:MAG: metabolite traffic protein EboE [Bacteroidota bacterium]
MIITPHHHLCYCTNIHPGESWEAVFQSLKTHTLPIKEQLCPNNPFGIGLRLSNQASVDLIKGNALAEFKNWLFQNDLYVFTMNGFPYGGFHQVVVKDKVHQPDWTTPERMSYTLRLFNLLQELLPEGTEGGISTSPLSYKYWHKGEEALEEVIAVSCQQFAELSYELHRIHETTGKFLHLDIEPEPDGILENTAEVLEFYDKYLIPLGSAYLSGEYGYNSLQSEEILRSHIQLCYDICHFAVAYENPYMALEAFRTADIRIGKIQISSALKADLPLNPPERGKIKQSFEAFQESTYLHQVVALDASGSLHQFRDLPDSFPYIFHPKMREWRTHFHVPLFTESYQLLQSTQSDIQAVLEIIKEIPTTRHLEVETYTWEVLPKELRVDLTQSIIRELEWVMKELE